MRINLQLQTSDFVDVWDDGNRIIIPQGNFKFLHLLMSFAPLLFHNLTHFAPRTTLEDPICYKKRMGIGGSEKNPGGGRSELREGGIFSAWGFIMDQPFDSQVDPLGKGHRAKVKSHQV